MCAWSRIAAVLVVGRKCSARPNRPGTWRRHRSQQTHRMGSRLRGRRAFLRAPTAAERRFRFTAIQEVEVQGYDGGGSGLRRAGAGGLELFGRPASQFDPRFDQLLAEAIVPACGNVVGDQVGLTWLEVGVLLRHFPGLALCDGPDRDPNRDVSKWLFGFLGVRAQRVPPARAGGRRFLHPTCVAGAGALTGRTHNFQSVWLDSSRAALKR